MIFEVIKRAFNGIAWGGLTTFLALTILMINDINPEVSLIWLYMLAGLVFGIYYGLASFIFEVPTWSPLKKTIIHFSLSITVYFTIALPLGWVPLTLWAIIISAFVFIGLYMIFWFCFWAYYKKMEASLNNSLENDK